MNLKNVNHNCKRRFFIKRKRLTVRVIFSNAISTRMQFMINGKEAGLISRGARYWSRGYEYLCFFST